MVPQLGTTGTSNRLEEIRAERNAWRNPAQAFRHSFSESRGAGFAAISVGKRGPVRTTGDSRTLCDMPHTLACAIDIQGGVCNMPTFVGVTATRVVHNSRDISWSTGKTHANSSHVSNT
jgi:hypothetical protein